MCTAVDRVFPGYRINRLRAILGKISQARAAGRSRRARQTPLHVRSGAGMLLLLLAAARPRVSPARRCAAGGRAGVRNRERASAAQDSRPENLSFWDGSRTAKNSPS
jgi:hypothetical protein